MTMLFRWVALPLAAASLLAIAACGAVHPTTITTDDKTEQVAITDVHISGGSGDITVRPGNHGQVRIHRTIRYAGDAPSGTTFRIEGSTLFLTTNCGRHCGVDYDVQVPEGVTVTGTTDIGATDLRGATTDLQAGLGDITVNLFSAGSVTARTLAGDIRVRVPSGTGYRIHASTGAGDTNLAVPNDPNGTYLLSLQAKVGDVVVSAGTAG